MQSSSGTRKIRGSHGGSPKVPIEPLQPLPPNPSSTLLLMSRRPRSLAERTSRIPQSERKLPSTRAATSSATRDASTASASGSAQPQSPVKLNDSLSTKTMRNLLQHEPGYRPPLSWSARQAKEKRRKDMLRLQQWLQGELGRFTQASDIYTPSPSTQTTTATKAAKKSSELSSLLRTTHQACDQAISQLLDFIITSSSGGDDIAGEILEELWQARGLLAKQQQASLKADLTATKEELHAAEKKACEAVEQLNLRLEAEEATAKKTSCCW
ncbi:hypothetical protein Ndes2526B_g07964 [Nannochloris sp. 'desiccata']